MAKNNLRTAIDIGIPEKDRAKIADGLSRLLADSFTLYLTTHKFHWNVKGPMFQTLHLMFEEQYNEQWLALDAIAERLLRSHGVRADKSMLSRYFAAEGISFKKNRTRQRTGSSRRR